MVDFGARAAADALFGAVTYVGTGPGDPDLLTLAAVSAIRNADAVLADTRELLELLRHPAVNYDITGLVTSFDDADFGAWMTPEEKAEITVEAARGGRRVARLVAGDPFLDAGVSEEAAACVRAGASFEVVPGVALLTAVPEYAGVALGDADGVQFMVARGGFDDPRARFWGFAGTLVMWCPAGRSSDLTQAAVDAGRDRTEPVLVTMRGGTTEQRTIATTLDQLSASLIGTAEDALVHVVMGNAAAMPRDELDWFETKPLFGWKVLVPRTKDLATPMTSRLRGYGAQCQEVATISVERPRTPHQMDKAVRGLVEGSFEWVAFTSGNAVRGVREKFEEYGLDARAFSGLKVAAAGTAAAEALKAWGIEPDLVPAGESSAALLADFPSYDADLDPINRVLVPRADIAIETLTAGLVQLGWEVDDVTAYRTVRAAPPNQTIREGIKGGTYDAVLFSSSSTVRNFVGIAGKPHPTTIVAAIGPATAKSCQEHGLRVDVLAIDPSGVGLADALAEFAAERRRGLLEAGQAVLRPSQRTRRRRSAS